MKKKISDLKRVLQQFSLIAQQLLQENSNLKQTCSSQQTALMRVTNSCTELKAECGRLRKERDSLSELQTECGRLRQERDSLAEECDSLREKAEQKEQVKKKKEVLIKDNENLKKENDRLNDRIEKLQDRVKALEDTIRQKDNEYNTKIALMLESIFECCKDSKEVVTRIQGEIAESVSSQTVSDVPEETEQPQDNKVAEAGLTDSNNDEDDENKLTDKRAVKPFDEKPDDYDDDDNDNDNAPSSSAQNDTAGNGGFNYGGDF